MILLYLLVHSDPLFPHPCLHGSVIISILLAMVLHEEYIPFCIQQILKEFLHSSSYHFMTVLSMSSIFICLLVCVQYSRGYSFSFHEFCTHNLWLHKILHTIRKIGRFLLNALSLESNEKI